LLEIYNYLKYVGSYSFSKLSSFPFARFITLLTVILLSFRDDFIFHLIHLYFILLVSNPHIYSSHVFDRNVLFVWYFELTNDSVLSPCIFCSFIISFSFFISDNRSFVWFESIVKTICSLVDFIFRSHNLNWI